MNQPNENTRTAANESILADLRHCFPTLAIDIYLKNLEGVDTGVYDTGLIIWGEFLATAWDMRSVGQWLAPAVLDQAYYKAKDPTIFLDACQRLLDATMPLFGHYYEEGHPFAGYLFSSTQPTDAGEKNGLIRRVGQGVEQFKEWVHYRQQTPAEQFLEMLSTIRIQITNDSTKEVAVLQKQTVLYGNWYDDQIRLKILSQNFYRYIRSGLTTESLRGIWVSLRQIKEVDLGLLLKKKELFEQVRENVPTLYSNQREYNIAELPLSFPQIRFAGLEGQRIITDEVNQYFWGEIFHLLYARKEWAWRAYVTLSDILGEPLTTEERNNPLSIWNKENTPQVPSETVESSLINEGVCRWKANKIDFAEMFYGLLEAKAIECSNIEVGATWLANVFGMDLGRVSNMLAPMRDRTKQTAFLDKVTQALKAKIEEDDNRIEERERR